MGAVEFVSIALPAVFWPLVVLLIATGQRKPLGRLIDRIRGGKAFGAEFDAPPRDLADAIQAGAASPEVEKVIQAGAELKATSTLGVSAVKEPSAPGSPDEEADFPPKFFERLGVAQRLDVDRRRDEIERVMQSAARWGAQMARNRPDRIDDWEPIVHWKDDGEPEIVAAVVPEFLQRRRKEVLLELQRAESLLNGAIRNNAAAEMEAAAADAALREAPEPSPELRKRAEQAANRHAETLRDMRRKEKAWVAHRNTVDRA
jgi:hypothetical protein